jgi:hypothetical protein
VGSGGARAPAPWRPRRPRCARSSPGSASADARRPDRRPRRIGSPRSRATDSSSRRPGLPFPSARVIWSTARRPARIASRIGRTPSMRTRSTPRRRASIPPLIGRPRGRHEGRAPLRSHRAPNAP